MFVNKLDMEEDEEQDLLEDVIPQIVSREEWKANPPLRKRKLVTPVEKVVFCHTESLPCYSKEHCAYEVKKFQEQCMNEEGKSDISHNFVIGREGTVFEARGWTTASSKLEDDTNDLSGKSISIAFIGYDALKPTALQLKAALGILMLGIRNNFITESVSISQINFEEPLFPYDELQGFDSNQKQNGDGESKNEDDFTPEFDETDTEIETLKEDAKRTQQRIDELFDD